MWSIDRVAGAGDVARCDALAGIPGLAHGFSTRAVDLAPGESDAQRRFLSATGMPGRAPAPMVQVHGARIVDTATLREAETVEADGSFALHDGRHPTIVPTVRYADCVPVLLADRCGRSVAAVHSGWRGTAAGIVRVAMARLRDHGIAAEGVIAALGPAIGPCCYVVGGEVRDAVCAAAGGAGERSSAAGGVVRVDLRAAIRAQLERTGIPGDSIHTAPWCTKCEPQLFFSYRRDGADAGRMMAAIGWGDPASVP